MRKAIEKPKSALCRVDIHRWHKVIRPDGTHFRRCQSCGRDEGQVYSAIPKSGDERAGDGAWSGLGAGGA
jgi:hypothetical protein